MKLLINTSTLNVGGGVQVALSFINELKYLDKNNKYYIFISTNINKQLKKTFFPSNFYFYTIQKSPAPLKYRKQIILQLDELEENIKPDIVFTVFGPSYWRPKNKHLMGFAIPWLINPKSSAFTQLSFFNRVLTRIKLLYLKKHVKQNADYFVVESLDTKNKLSNILSINNEKINVVGNTVSKIYFNDKFSKFNMPKRLDGEFRFITISHNHSHKNLKILKEVIPYLKNCNILVRFFVTIDKKSFKSLFNGLEKYIINIGPIKINDCPSVYQQCDALFLPTLLECFSASYPEAMKMQKPILTSNYSFAKDICDDVALYFDPLNPKDISEKIKMLISNHFLQEEMIEKGKKRLETFETSQNRAKKYLMLCKKILEDN